MGEAINLSELIGWQLNSSQGDGDDGPPLLKCPVWTL